MQKLVQAIGTIRAKLEGLRKRSLKETPTRTIIINPLLAGLGWDVLDPDEVEQEYPTVDGKSVDYALKIANKPELLVEAKPLDDPLEDVKAITQVVGYATNDGIDWCILTNGAKWKVYSSVEKCSAPNKLMFEVSLDPVESKDLSIQDLAQKMWRFSREETAKGTLDDLGEKTFTDGKVRKALDSIMHEAPRAFLNIIRKSIGEEKLTPQRIKESVSRVWANLGLTGGALGSAVRGGHPRETEPQDAEQGEYDEPYYTKDKPREVLELYRAVDRYCLSLNPGQIQKRYLKRYIGYFANNRSFCTVLMRQGSIQVYLNLKYRRLDNPPSFARDMTNIGHWGMGDLQIVLASISQVEQATQLIRESFESRQ